MKPEKEIVLSRRDVDRLLDGWAIKKRGVTLRLEGERRKLFGLFPITVDLDEADSTANK